ncbi:CO/xanthine dehydrogenase Mo-binding subunit [Hydrogenispora ethanolica]|uniref:CO/xanthine dehydrogenase Mo-binding subunit n=1 Tax=Hydrogenispora ethanolica TaxID=1082276 RepID=A0A4R1S2M8_HYDET|nr:xanthine dehydrogenase family protein molybdopterin-binding subunit [Hydrogenispora ethanolica]TCL73154.1 CO/xanthine dehydrogenase Mo-binding subunit [Hydrogenispora ethanolica]
MSHEISRPVAKIDNREKLAGDAQYLGDLHPQGMLYAKTLRSVKARAVIRAITVPPLPEGYFIVDRHDVPGKNRVKILSDDQPFFAEDRVNYIGEPILLVVGPEKERILAILDGIRVDYEDLPPILTLADAERSQLPPLFGADNYFAEYHFSRGQVDEAFSRAARVIEGEYQTGYQEHVYLEPQGVLAVHEAGKITVYGSIQCPYYVKNALIQAFGWDGDRVRVVQTTTGGGFGGKEDYPSLIAGQAGFAALKTGRPVQLLFDRAEDIEVTTKRHPSAIRLRTALDGTGRITAMEADIRLNAGAYAGLSAVVLQRSMFNIAGVYQLPALKVRGRAVATNTVPNGAFRGFGSPQAFFAVETHLDEVARELGVDPLEFKIKHMAKQGDWTATGGTYQQEIKLPELIAEVEELSGYRRKTADFARRDGARLQGIGMALFLHGCGFTGSGERDHIKARVKLHKRADGQVEVLAANADMGQGLRTTLRKIVAQTLERPLETIIYDNPDTDRVPDSGPTVASRTVMIVGKLLEEAARKLKAVWDQPGEQEVVKDYEHPANIVWDNDTFSGDAYPAYSWGVNAVEVEVDPSTYQIDVKGVWSAFDVGVAIDERIIRGQVEGGVLQGLGYGSLEVMECRDGRIQQRSVTDYIIPTALDCPRIESRLIDNPYERGPFGAKGAGELTLVGAAPALALAVGNALGVPIRRLPVTPEYLMEVMEHGGAD